MNIRRKPKLYSPKEKLFNCRWIFTLGDPDDHPSVPHAHDQENGYRLNAWTGEIYPAGKDRKSVIGTLSEREIRKLHTDPNFLKFAQKQIAWYQKKFPYITFFIPEWFNVKCAIRKTEFGLKNDTIIEYIFIGKAHIKLQTACSKVQSLTKEKIDN